MKITLDTINKIITLEESINLSELFKELDRLGIDFNEYQLDIVKPVNTPWIQPWIQPWVQPQSPYYFTYYTGSPYTLYDNTICENKKSQH